MGLRGLLWTKHSPWAPPLLWTTCHTRKVSWRKACVFWPLCVPRLLTKTRKLREQVQLQALRLGSSEWNSVGSSTPRHPQKDIVVRVRVRGGTPQPARKVHTHYGEWCALTTTAEVRNQEETQISHFGLKHFQETTTKTMATFDTTTYHIWQLSEKTAVSTPSHQRVQDSFILGPQFKKSRKEDGPTEGKKRLKKQLYNTYSAHQSGCLPPCKNRLL